MSLYGILMDSEEGRKIWASSPPTSEDVIAIDDDRHFVLSSLPSVLLYQTDETNVGPKRRVFCFLNPDQALLHISLLNEIFIPRLILVDMIFGSEERGPEIIKHIRQQSTRPAIVGYSAYRNSLDTFNFTAGTLSGTAASEVGADGWFNKSELLDEDYKLNRFSFLSCVARAIERRQSHIRELESELARLRNDVLVWAQTFIESMGARSLLSSEIRSKVNNLIVTILPIRSVEQQLNDNSNALMMLTLSAKGPISGNATPTEAIKQHSKRLVGSLRKFSEQSPDILDAHLTDKERKRQLHKVERQLNLFANKFGEEYSINAVQAAVIQTGRDGKFVAARTLAYACRAWSETRSNLLTANPPKELALRRLTAFLKAAQGQAAADLGLLHEATEYLGAALSEADFNDVPFVRLIAESGLLQVSLQSTSIKDASGIW